MPSTSAHVLRIFLTGLLAALPLAATIAIFWWAAELTLRWVGPDSAAGRVFTSVGVGVTGSEVIGYLIGISALAGAIFLLGLLIEANLQRGLARVVDAVLGRIPVVRGVYDLAQKLVGLFAQRDPDGVRSMRAVWCHFGGPPDDGADHVAVLGLLSTAEPVLIEGKPYVGVIVPTAPVPVGGGLLFLPQAWVRPADVGIEALTSIYVSMGITAAQHLNPGGPRPDTVEKST